MRAFLTEVALLAGPLAGYFHIGDLIWRLSPSIATDTPRWIELWEDETGQPIGFAWLDAPDLVDVQIHPRLLQPAPVLREMVAWAERALRQRAADNGTAAPSAVRVDIPVSDGALSAALGELGFRDTGRDLFVLLARELLDLDDPVIRAVPGVVVRDLAVVVGDDVDRRVVLEHAVWPSSRANAESYHQLRGQPVYRADLDLVALAPNGEFAAYCICWLDPETRVGQFEPVGSSPHHRRQGYGAAVMTEGLRRLHTLGAVYATVGTGADNAAALRLYESLGFYEAVRYREWTKGIGV